MSSYETQVHWQLKPIKTKFSPSINSKCALISPQSLNFLKQIHFAAMNFFQYVEKVNLKIT